MCRDRDIFVFVLVAMQEMQMEMHIQKSKRLNCESRHVKGDFEAFVG